MLFNRRKGLLSTDPTVKCIAFESDRRGQEHLRRLRSENATLGE